MSVTKPINHGKRWGVEEVDTLLAAIATNSSYKDIARIHGRTSGSIGGKLRQIALKMYVNKCHMDEIIRITRLTKANIEQSLLALDNGWLAEAQANSDKFIGSSKITTTIMSISKLLTK